MREKSIYAFLLDCDGQETIVGMRDEKNWTPLVCSSESQMREMRKVAEGLVDKLLPNQEIRLVRFSKRLEIEKFKRE